MRAKLREPTGWTLINCNLNLLYKFSSSKVLVPLSRRSQTPAGWLGAKILSAAAQQMRSHPRNTSPSLPLLLTWLAYNQIRHEKTRLRRARPVAGSGRAGAQGQTITSG